MPRRPQSWRLGLFCLACVVLAAAAICFGAGGHSVPMSSPTGAAAPPFAAAPPQSVAGAAARLRARLGQAARRFLAAFFHYEVGELGPRWSRQLRATATPGFVAELLRAPPRRPPGRPAAAVAGALRISVASISPPRALVSGSASRGGVAEQFSFLFEADHGDWLASGPGE